MLPRCGRVAHVCEANCICNKFFLLQLHFLKLSNSNKVGLWESRLQIQTRQRGNCSMLAGKSRGGTPFCRMLKIVFSKNHSFHVSHETVFLEYHSNPVRQGWGTSPACLGIAIAPETLLHHFNLLFWRQLRFFQFSLRFLLQFPDSFICSANVGCSPTPRQHFWKIAGSKNFLFACGLWLKTLLLDFNIKVGQFVPP